ncbi:ABC-three component system protein [Paraburkholderia tropica]|uniref:ABC-three component system protein n=1 Tax=Paraburkholderia tropica TaxID=92647 RepID=UPI0031E31386
MQKKLRLKQADEYDYRVATLYAARAVVAYMDSSEQCQRIGNEQGDVDEWDDVVLHLAQGATVHCQIKRQTTDFSNHEIRRGLKSKGQNKGDKQDLSALDSAFEKLAKHFAKPVSERGAAKQFRLAIPNANIHIKKDLTIVHLRDVCSEWSKAGASVEAFAKSGSPTEKVRIWLSTWCDFGSDEAMFECLRVLEICEHGDESRLDEDCRDSLTGWYSSPDDVRREVRDFLVTNASSEQSITPRMIAGQIDRYVRPQRRAWTRYNMANSLDWQISGTLSGHGTDIEFPETVVDRLWEPPEDRSYELQFGHGCSSPPSTPLQFSLMRLALHVAQGVAVSASGVAGWHATVAQTVRRTLGHSEDELNALRWGNWLAAPTPADHRRLRTTSHVDREASELDARMTALTWKHVKNRVSAKIVQGRPNEVRDAVEAVWGEWQDEIDADPLLQQELAAEMLYAKSEGSLTIGSVRSGLRTVALIADALVMLLHLAVASDASDRSWRNLGSDVSVRTVALLYWAGPNQQVEHIRRFFDDDDTSERAEFLGKETARVLVLPQARSSVSAVYGKTLADGRDGGDSIAEARTPTSIVTYSQEYQDALRQKTIASLKDFLAKALQGRDAQRTQHINTLTTGNPHAD